MRIALNLIDCPQPQHLKGPVIQFPAVVLAHADLVRKRLRLRILAVAGRLVRTARRHILKIDPAWPWADTITTAHKRLAALPVP
jgi:hypothetical protein